MHLFNIELSAYTNQILLIMYVLGSLQRQKMSYSLPDSTNATKGHTNTQRD